MQTEIEKTRHWLQTIVIGLNFCPFAQREFKSDRIRYRLSSATDVETCLQELLTEWMYLDDNEDTATTLLIYPALFADFEDYLDLVAISDELLEMEGYAGIYQTASFHPYYQFADTSPDDPENQTNRAPYPMLHLLRESDLSRAIDSHPDTAAIPQRNQQLCRDLGIEALRALLSPGN